VGGVALKRATTARRTAAQRTPDAEGASPSLPLTHIVMRAIVIGAGLAGSEAAWQLAQRGVRVVLYEMKPARFSPAHQSPEFAELVCSNSLRGAALTNAVGLLKEEMRRLGSLVLRVAGETAVPAGRALAVDRTQFSARITAELEAHPNVAVRREEVTQLPTDELAVLASGPLTAPALAAELSAIVGGDSLYFYDAISPIVYADSLDLSQAFRASRWEEGEGDYWNLALDEPSYQAFVAALLAADVVPLHAFEKELYFEGCLPIEEMARRGPGTLRFGPLKAAGLTDPRTGRWPYAVAQLRHEDKRGTIFNLVGFQTKLKQADQQRIFRTLPALREAVFARYGSVHRNTFVNAPRVLNADLSLRGRPNVLLAGQMAGVEGYVESAALGFMAAQFAHARLRGEAAPEPAPETAHGALLAHLREEKRHGFQPMNVNFGLFPPLADARAKRPDKNARLSERALAALGPYLAATAVRT
jgi:methylenetetrahydrofolate--tRNA-(uracil-5-)-methyltransferase